MRTGVLGDTVGKSVSQAAGLQEMQWVIMRVGSKRNDVYVQWQTMGGL